MREIAFNLIYVSAVLMLGVLGMTLYSFQQADMIQDNGESIMGRGERGIHNSG